MSKNQEWNIFTDNSEGSIMHMVQMSRLYPDSKTFVDMALKKKPEIIRDAFKQLIDSKNGLQPLSLEDIRSFVEENFEADVELESCDPTDWKEDPKLLHQIRDSRYAEFASELNRRWKMLCRRISSDVELRPERYSLIYLPHPVVVPGGRFREIYYWDSYWIVLGLLHCEMFETVKGILLNFVHLIKNYGMIPNGGRRYYLNRSQPPLFIQMVQKYVEVTGDLDFVKDNLMHMETEFMYWYYNHMVSFNVSGREYKMAIYCVSADGPRPESYFEDFELAYQNGGSESERQDIYHQIKAGAETGWDFSSRWFVSGKGYNTSMINNEDGVKINGIIPGEEELQLRDTKTSHIIPVELNCFLEKNARILSDFYSNEGNDEKRSKFKEIADELRKAVDEVLWNDDIGAWLDYNHELGQQRTEYSLSNLIPLWTETFSSENRNLRIEKIVNYIKREDLEKFSGGLPTTKVQTGQQWDFPNCWPPLQHMVVVGLERSQNPEAQKLAKSFAEKSIKSSYLNFVEKGHMYEKYDATNPVRVGSGGEYSVQLGFGWTNGVILDFLAIYGEKISAPEN